MGAIIQALKQDGVRIDNMGRWLIWDDISHEWAVYGRDHGQRKTRTFYQGDDEERAVRYLLRKDRE